MILWIDVFIQFSGWSVEIQKHWSAKLQSQGHLFPYTWIAKDPTVIRFALQRPLSNLPLFALHSSEFWNFSDWSNISQIENQ